MLRLVDIVKHYKTGDSIVKALKGINLSFRQNEFVSILGPSGCGKTTLLNIVGGLDKYTKGDLFILNKSTKQYKDKDWDIYRNHRIGFIFQSYNLIPHQTVLKNVELALTISGMSKAQRVEKAKKALDKVGLSDQYHKKPNQLSGGQSQRVAIARALVNDPEILLADEPTGALDTKTSTQIMDLMREIAKEKLVIMVTHNAEIAEEYSTRIIKLLDGELVSDSNPFSTEDEIKTSKEIIEAQNESIKRQSEQSQAKTKAKAKKEKAKMSFFTAFKLSLQNLFSKKARTIMIGIAGSIGIIGISLVLSFSYGINLYIDNMQNDMLSANPIEITQSTYDMSGLFTSVDDAREVLDKVNQNVNINSAIESMIKRGDEINNIIINNTITKEYVDYLLSMPSDYYASIYQDFGIDVSHNIYTNFTNTNVDGSANTNNISLTAIKNIYTSILDKTQFKDYSAYITGITNPFKQAPIEKDYLLTQYTLLDGEVATKEDEIMIVLNKNWELNDLLLAQLGYYTQDEFVNTIFKSIESPSFNEDMYRQRISFDEIKGKEFYYYPNDVVFDKTNFPIVAGVPNVPFSYNYKVDDSFTNPIKLKITGILEPNENLNYGSLSSGFYYTKALTDKILTNNNQSEIVKYYTDNDILSLPNKVGEQSVLVPVYQYTFTYLDDNGIRKSETTAGQVGKASSLDPMMKLIFDMMGLPSDSETTYSLSLQELGGIDIPKGIYLYSHSFDEKQNLLNHLDRWNSEETITFTFNNSTTTLTKDQRSEIKYTDGLSIIITIISQFINIVTGALIGFTSLALLVSCVMIGIITYVSVVERIKEIGIIRSLGGSKRDVSNLFTAETFIIGLTSGLIGICFTWVASFLINILMKGFVGMSIAVFPIHYALIMMGLSIGLTLISGLMPSQSAAKKDPVVALRTE